jgi:DNA replication protein DnaD
MITAAMELALANNAGTWNYVNTILVNCLKKNIKTLEQFEVNEKLRKEQSKPKITPFKKVSNMDEWR